MMMLIKLALTSPTGGGRPVGIVRSRAKATEFSLVNILGRGIHSIKKNIEALLVAINPLAPEFPFKF